MFDKIKIILGLASKFSKVTVGETEWNYDGDELVEGISVVDNEGNPIPDGQYELDNKVVVIADGKVASVTVKEEVEETPSEETPEETPTEEPTEEPQPEEAPKEEEAPEVEVPTEEVPQIEEVLSSMMSRLMDAEERISALEAKLDDTKEVAEQFAAVQPSEEPYYTNTETATADRGDDKFDSYAKFKALQKMKQNK